MNFFIQSALLRIKGAARAMHEEAEAASKLGAHIEPASLEYYAELLDRAAVTLEFEQSGSLTWDDSVWLKSIIKSLERSVATAEAAGEMISADEMRSLIETVNKTKTQGGAQ